MNFQGNCYPPGLGKLFKFSSLKANIICFNLLCASRIVFRVSRVRQGRRD